MLFEGRLGVCKITSSVVSPLALSLPLLDSSALPQTLPRTFYSLFIFLPTLRLLSSHIRHNSLFSLNPFLYFHFTLQMMLELKNLLSFEYFLHIYSQYLFISLLICQLSKLLWPSKGRLAAWLDNDDNIVKIWSWYWRQACLVMMIGKWQLTGAWCRTAHCPWPAVQPGASTSKYDIIHL